MALVKHEALAEIRSWFARYVRSFARGGEPIHPLLELKVQHIERVAAEARGLARDLGWSVDAQNTAEALGWLHDVGRFPQFAEYRTFSDAISVDHGEHGAAVARRSSVLDGLSAAEREAILDGIRHHNARTVPDDLPRASLPWIGLIRDADKLDVFHVVLEALDRDGFRDLPEMLPHLTMERSVGPEVIEDALGRRNCALNRLRTLGDFLVMLLSWIHDFNTRPALRRVRERRIVARIASWLPRDPALERLEAVLHAYAAGRLDGEAG